VNPDKGVLLVPQANELIPDTKGLFEKLKRVDVLDRRKAGGWTNEEVVALAFEEVDLSGSCLVVVNTKNAAQSLRLLSVGRPDIAVYHLSTNMCPAHRKHVLSEIRAELDGQGDRPVLCISTQLIEAGVDIDFGSVVRCLAGIDSIAQAAGRCNRHGRRAMGRVHIVNPSVDNLDKLPDLRIARTNAERVLDDYRDNPQHFGDSIIGLEAIRRFYQYYFFDRAPEMDYPVRAELLGHGDTVLNLLSENSLALHQHGRIAPDTYFRQSFMAAGRAFKAIDSPTQGVLVPYGEDGRKVIAELCASHLPEQEFKLLRRAQQFSVNVFPHVLDRLLKHGAVRVIIPGTGILALSSQFYSREFGLSETAVEDMELLSV